MKSSGEIKYRAIDDFSRSAINACTVATEKLRCDAIDTFYEVLRALSTQLEVPFLHSFVVLCNWVGACACLAGGPRHVEVGREERLQIDSRLRVAP